ncbi:MAG: beta-agarase [Armatimonadota bacterium]|nr:MAG: beta-agarase [Armatimonadota bacterium]
MSDVLLDFAEDFYATSVVASSGVTASQASAGQGRVLRVEVASGGGPGSVTLKAPEGGWDLSDRLYVAVDLRNAGPEETMVHLEVNSQGADAWSNRNEVMTVVPAGESKTVKALIVRLPLGDDSALGRYFAGPTGVIGGDYSSGMLGLPGGFTWHWYRIDPSQVTQVVVSVPFAKGGEAIEIARVLSMGRYDPPTEKELESGFAPFVDGFGQYRHREWPGKVHSVEDLVRAREAEEADLAAHPGPKEWNQYGGWAGGPQLEATGRFRAAKHGGKWWLVDPEGRLFWSHGPDCISLDWASTRIKGREHYFAELPEEGSPLSECYSTRDGERYGYSFAGANLRRKHGKEWRTISIDRIHERLRSWGMNTVANWPSPEVYLRRRTPYAVDIHYESRSIEGTKKLPDPFDDGFREAVRASIAQRHESADDPWCIGYFVDNELGWGQDIEAAPLVAKAPPDQPAKQELVRELREKYGTIAALNAAWGTGHGSWETLLECREGPDAQKAHDDLAAFYEGMAEEYFRVCREEVKAASPEGLYLGCRMHQINPRAARVAARYCDVLSINCYRYDVRTMPLPEGLDVPVIIGEWHFGALDRGPLHPGLRNVPDQCERAVLYKSYLRSALSHPLVVGAHWFQYGDQATTGRDDGENCQVGFIDVCDTPYGETVEACREVGYAMCEYRLGGS